MTRSCQASVRNFLLLLFSILIVFSFKDSWAVASGRHVVLDGHSIGKVKCSDTACFFPSLHPKDADIRVVGEVVWDSNLNLVIHAKGNIIFDKTAKIIMNGDGTLFLKAGMEPGKSQELQKSGYLGTVVLNSDEKQLFIKGQGRVKIYYNPERQDREHKYLNYKLRFYEKFVESAESGRLDVYMLVNDVVDLQRMRVLLYANYALSQDIDAQITQKWDKGRGFNPVSSHSEDIPFSGDFDGNGYAVKNLYINRPERHDIGLFGKCRGSESSPNIIENLGLINFNVRGNHYVGALAGSAAYTQIFNINVKDVQVGSVDVAGGLIGTTFGVQMDSLKLAGQVAVSAVENQGIVVGGAGNSSLRLCFSDRTTGSDILSSLNILGNQDDKTFVEVTVCNDPAHETLVVRRASCDQWNFTINGTTGSNELILKGRDSGNKLLTTIFKYFFYF